MARSVAGRRSGATRNFPQLAGRDASTERYHEIHRSLRAPHSPWSPVGGLALWPRRKSGFAAAFALAETGGRRRPRRGRRDQRTARAARRSRFRRAGDRSRTPRCSRSIFTADFKGNGREKMRAILTTKTGDAADRARAGRADVRKRAATPWSSCAPDVVDARARARRARSPSRPPRTRSGNKVAEAALPLSFGTAAAARPAARLRAGAPRAHRRRDPDRGARAHGKSAAQRRREVQRGRRRSCRPASTPRVSSTDTADILAALLALRAIGRADDDLALTIDPQLKIESMIDPLARAAAMRYYGITPETEWEYWKTELPSGEPTTRHYALYGIARFYPEVALEMLPEVGARNHDAASSSASPRSRRSPTRSAPEALPILRQLADELGR